MVHQVVALLLPKRATLVMRAHLESQALPHNLPTMSADKVPTRLPEPAEKRSDRQKIHRLSNRH